MKFLLALTLLFPSFVLAYPAIGDFVRYEAKYEGDIVAMERKVLSYDASEDKFEVRSLVIFHGDITRDETFMLPKAFLFNAEKMANLLKTCWRREGIVGDETVEGVTFKTCSFYNEDSMMTSTIGDVPFGDVRYQLYLGDGEFLDFNLVKFRHGN